MTEPPAQKVVEPVLVITAVGVGSILTTVGVEVAEQPLVATFTV